MWLAAIQLVSGRYWQDNREQIAAELAALPAERPLLVLLPENFALFGERQGYLDGAERIGEGPIQQQLAAWAKEYGIWLVAGAMPTTIAGSDHIHTSSLVFDPVGELRGHYHKIHLFDVDVADNHGRYRESETFSPGQDCVLIDSPFGPLGLSICYDLRFPELYRQLA
ncbi:nitrilase-related carbon-nitrogen hydrolase, partial [Aeromonas salmonicida]